MKKVRFLFIFSLLFAGIYFGQILDVSAAEKISLGEAKKVALNHLEDTEYSGELKKIGDLKLKTFLYDVDDTLLGYYFTFENSETESRYILVSASTDLPPVLQYGGGKLDNENEEQLGKSKKIYYLGPLQFLYGSDKSEIQEKFNNKKKKWLDELEIQGEQDSKEYKKVLNKDIPRVKRNSSNQKQWVEELSTNTSGGMTTLAVTDQTTLAVPRIWQRSSGVTNKKSACGPATAAMVANYLNLQNFNVRGIEDYNSRGTFINHMYDELGTYSWGTTIDQYKTGLNKHLEHDYSSNRWTTWTYPAYGYYAHYKDSINNKKPVGLRFDLFVHDGAYINYHFVAGIGYRYNNGAAEFGIKDPDNGESNTGNIWINWNANNDDMWMGLVNTAN